MKKIKKMMRGPMMLMNRVFTIPIFSANNQEYICTEVADLGSDAVSKTYGVYFKWIQSSYAVPEILRMDVIINTGSYHIEIQLFEKQKNGNYIPLYHRAYDRERISSVTNIQNMIKDLTGR